MRKTKRNIAGNIKKHTYTKAARQRTTEAATATATGRNKAKSDFCKI